MPTLLPDQGGVLRGVHACEVKHGYVGLPVVVDGVVQGRQLVVCAKVGCLSSVGKQRFLVDIVSTQQPLRFYVVLFSDDAMLLKNPGGLTFTSVSPGSQHTGTQVSNRLRVLNGTGGEVTLLLCRLLLTGCP